MPIALLNAVHFKTTGSSEMSKKAIKPDSKIEKSKKRSDAACEMHQIPITLLACKNSAITLLPKPRPLCPGEKKRLSTSRYDFGSVQHYAKPPSGARDPPLHPSGCRGISGPRGGGKRARTGSTWTPQNRT